MSALGSRLLGDPWQARAVAYLEARSTEEKLAFLLDMQQWKFMLKGGAVKLHADRCRSSIRTGVRFCSADQQ